MTETPTTFYIFHGDDDLGIDEAVRRLRAQMGDGPEADLNISDFNGEETSVPAIIGAVISMPFLADKRLIIVRGLIGWITRKGAGNTGKQALAQLLDELPHLPEHARLVLVERQVLPDNNKLVKLAQSEPGGYIRVFSAPKDSTSWITKRAREEYQAEIEPAAAAAVASVTGDDLRRADNELLKLVHYVNGERPITEDDVARLTPYVPEANIFKMVDALGEGRGKAALLLMHRLLDEQGEDPFRLYGMIVRQFRLLLLTREHLGTGGSPGALAKIIGVPPFVAQNLARQSRRFTVEQLEHIYHALHENDLKMKTGQIKPQLALDLFVAGLTR